MSDEYNGWKNRATWNVALWLGNDYTVYRASQGYSTYPQPYLSLRMDFMNGMFKCTHTGDGVSLWDKELDIEALDEMIREF
jgi:hypothetical protein|tara:strand:- start:393 stop:635 length:243 start_codon:yes stop_codon:yes gene_type:complete